MIDPADRVRPQPSWIEVARVEPTTAAGRSPLHRIPAVVAGVVVAARLAPRGLPLALLAGAAVVAIGSTALARRVARWVGHRVGLVVSWLALVPIGLVAVVVPWALRPAVGVDPLPSRRSAISAWHRLGFRTVDARHPWTPTRRWEEWSGATRWRRRIVIAVLAVAMVAGGALGAQRERRTPDRRAYSLSEPTGVAADAGIPAAFADAPWYPKYRSDLEYAGTWLGGAQVIDNIEFADGHSRYLNVEDGYRVTWTPPACSCRRLTVWVYGASTIFGLGQRDGHTIPSELARAAWADGYALDVANRGIPGEEHWQEVNRLRWDLTRLPKPDLVVFYDGASEIVGASWLEQHHLGDVAYPIEPLTEGFLDSDAVVDAMRLAKTGGAEQPPVPDGFWVPTTVPHPDRTPAQVGQLAVTRYERARVMSTDLADIHDLDVHWYWQPTRFSRPPVAGEPTTADDERSRQVSEAARAALPAGVVDLGDALDGSDAPIFSDDVHHNELGARLIAAAMYRDLRPAIVEAAGSEAGG